MKVSVVTWPTGQLVTVGLHDVMVYVRVLTMVEVSVLGGTVMLLLLGEVASDEVAEEDAGVEEGSAVEEGISDDSEGS